MTVELTSQPHTPPASTPAALHDAIQLYAATLEEIEGRADTSNGPQVIEALESATTDILGYCALAESSMPMQDVLSARADLQAQTARVLEQSWIIDRARRWPRGYQGDFEIIETAYAARPRSGTPMGRHIDNLVLQLDLAHAVRGRLAKMRDVLREEIMRRSNGARVVNLACGPCRELLELSGIIRERRTTLLCVDHDPAALAYAGELVSTVGLDEASVHFTRFNALRLATPSAWQQALGEADIIYSTGLFDYLRDRTVGNLLRAAFDNLRPGGQLIVPFKDSTQYDATPFRWLMNWTGFLERDGQAILDLVRQAGLEGSITRVDRDETGIIVFVCMTR